MPGGVRVLGAQAGLRLESCTQGKERMERFGGSGQVRGRGLRLQPAVHADFQMPGLIWDPEAKQTRIDEFVCVGCGVCAQVCPHNAITVKR